MDVLGAFDLFIVNFHALIQNLLKLLAGKNKKAIITGSCTQKIKNQMNNNNNL